MREVCLDLGGAQVRSHPKLYGCGCGEPCPPHVGPKALPCHHLSRMLPSDSRAVPTQAQGHRREGRLQVRLLWDTWYRMRAWDLHPWVLPQASLYLLTRISEGPQATFESGDWATTLCGCKGVMIYGRPPAPGFALADPTNLRCVSVSVQSLSHV